MRRRRAHLIRQAILDRRDAAMIESVSPGWGVNVLTLLYTFSTRAERAVYRELQRRASSTT